MPLHTPLPPGANDTPEAVSVRYPKARRSAKIGHAVDRLLALDDQVHRSLEERLGVRRIGANSEACIPPVKAGKHRRGARHAG